jgi:hypothetical protein
VAARVAAAAADVIVGLQFTFTFFVIAGGGLATGDHLIVNQAASITIKQATSSSSSSHS